MNPAKSLPASTAVFIDRQSFDITILVGGSSFTLFLRPTAYQVFGASYTSFASSYFTNVINNARNYYTFVEYKK